MDHLIADIDEIGARVAGEEAFTCPITGQEIWGTPLYPPLIDWAKIHELQSLLNEAYEQYCKRRQQRLDMDPPPGCGDGEGRDE